MGCAGEWRREQHGGQGSLVPDELWNGAVEAAGVDGVWATAHALHFNYQRLRERVAEQRARQAAMTKHGWRWPRRQPQKSAARSREGTASGKSAVTTGPRFIALEIGRLSGPRGAVVDQVNRRGDRMRVEVPDGLDVLGLADRFWRCTP